jgi:hypothetical protein
MSFLLYSIQAEVSLTPIDDEDPMTRERDINLRIVGRKTLNDIIITVS